MEKRTLFEHVLDTWQSLDGVWQQDAFLLWMCVIVVVMLFSSGAVIGLFLQSLWGIFTSGHQRTETDTSPHP